MKNRMQDLDFEQNVAFDKVQEYEFTRRAAQRFRQSAFSPSCLLGSAAAWWFIVLTCPS